MAHLRRPQSRPSSLTEGIRKLARRVRALFGTHERYRPEKHYMRGRPSKRSSTAETSGSSSL